MEMLPTRRLLLSTTGKLLTLYSLMRSNASKTLELARKLIKKEINPKIKKNYTIHRHHRTLTQTKLTQIFTFHLTKHLHVLEEEAKNVSLGDDSGYPSLVVDYIDAVDAEIAGKNVYCRLQTAMRHDRVEWILARQV